jgi:Fe-S-cluster containining protein
VYTRHALSVRGVFNPCLWLHVPSKRCRHYNHRPSICRNFPLGGEECRFLRREQGLDA